MTVKQLFRNKTFSILFPPCLFAVLGVLLYIICVCMNGFDGVVLAEYLLCILACFAPALFGAIVRRPFHPFLAWSIGIVCFLGVFLQQAACIYTYWAGYDRLVQAVFALLASGCLYCLILRWKGGHINTSGMLVFIIIGAAGICGIFEVFEYFCDLYGIVWDPQRWRVVIEACIDASYDARIATGDLETYVYAAHAMRETIDDMSVTVLFSMMFCLGYLVNLFIGDGLTFERFFSESTVFHSSAGSKVEMLTGFGEEEDINAGRGYRAEGTKFQQFIHSRNFIIWSPSVFVAIVGVICFIIRACTGEVNWLVILQFLSSMAAGFAVPVIGLILHRQFSPSLNYAIGFFVIFGLFFERAFNIYDNFFRYDKVLHTFVGLLGGAIALVLLLRWKGDRMHPVGVMWTIMLVSVGIGIIWEIFEFDTDFSGTDPQVWYDVVINSVDASYAARIAENDPSIYIIVGNALTDTMDDISVTVIGAGGFIIAYIIALRFEGGRVFKTFFSEQRITRYNPPAHKGDYLTGPALADAAAEGSASAVAADTVQAE